MNEATLKQVQSVISAKRTTLTPEDAKDLATVPSRFKRERVAAALDTAADRVGEEARRGRGGVHALQGRRPICLIQISTSTNSGRTRGLRHGPGRSRPPIPRARNASSPGFEDIARFYEEHGRLPQHGEERDIFERLYAVASTACGNWKNAGRLLITPSTSTAFSSAAPKRVAGFSRGTVDDGLRCCAELSGHRRCGRHHQAPPRKIRVKKSRAAEEIAGRDPCADFEKFEPLFKQVQEGPRLQGSADDPSLRQGCRLSRRPIFTQGAVLHSSAARVAYVAKVGETHQGPQRRDRCPSKRVIYSNGTESDLLLRSLQRALYKDEAGRRITEPEAGPLFSGVGDDGPAPLFADEAEDGDVESGTIYVLRSKSDHPFVAEHREVIHKIGVTGGTVAARLAGADKSATYLLADVEVVATYKVFGVNCRQLEALIHKVFAPALLDLTIPDRFGNPVKPREWFLVPINVIDEAVQHIRDGSIVGYRYDPAAGRLIG
jgi:hypothetical protein